MQLCHWALGRMTDRKIEMDAVRSAEFKEAFDEFDKVRPQLADESWRVLKTKSPSGQLRNNFPRGTAGCSPSDGAKPHRG